MVIELGASGGWGLEQGGSAFGPEIGLEFAVIEHWLEIEASTSPQFSGGYAEFDTDLTFKKPFDLTIACVWRREWPRTALLAAPEETFMRRLLIMGSIIAALLGATAFELRPVRISREAIGASVTQTADAIERAWQLPVAKTFNHQLFAQSNLSRCGPASLANVFRSLSEAAKTESEVLAETGRCWTGFCLLGLTLDELAEVARAHTNRKVTVLRDLTPDEFREHLLRSNDASRRYVINFRRREIFGAGKGHFSPIAGYFENEDLVFVLDVNENFRPWLIERSRLFAAMNTLDGDKKRGLLLIE